MLIFLVNLWGSQDDNVGEIESWTAVPLPQKAVSCGNTDTGDPGGVPYFSEVKVSPGTAGVFPRGTTFLF